MKKRESAKKTKSRHPTEKNSVKPTHTHPTISCGKREREVLSHILSLEGRRFNIKEYARIKKIPRSSVYEILKRLDSKELITRGLAENKITKRGENYLECTNGGVGSVRRECRESNKLSTHYHKFKLPIKDKTQFKIEKLSNLNHKGIKENKLKNLHQTIITFEDAKVIINPKQVIISVFEFLGGDVEDSDIKSLTTAVNYAEILKKAGVETEGVMVEEGHWARVESALSDFLQEKVDDRYFLTLDDGSKFWIDHSNGKQEDETNNKVVRQRVDNFLNQVASNDFNLTDIEKIKESLGFITKLESSRLQDQIEENKLQRKKLDMQKPNLEIKFNGYIG